jgi:esterase/lipase superfamily enzyme
VALGLAFLAACATNIPIDTDHRTAGPEHVDVVNLRFVTNRALRPLRRSGSYFDNEPGTLSAGACMAGFEEGDRSGEVLRIDRAPVDDVFRELAPGRIVVYVHGYSESFAKSCRRAALLQKNLGLDDRLLLFSWPSDSYVTYARDARDLSESLDDFNRLLTQLSETVGEERIVLMAHSMGSRAIVDALRMREQVSAKFSEAVFIAPDIRRDVFIDNVQMLQSKVSELTVYMSDNDLVLWISTMVNVSGRLGIAKDIEVDTRHARVIDITPTGVSFIGGHLYHLYNPAVAEDLRVILGTAAKGADRAWQRIPGATDGVWLLEAS